MCGETIVCMKQIMETHLKTHIHREMGLYEKFQNIVCDTSQGHINPKCGT